MILQEAGRLDQAAIDTVRRECWPDLRDEHELHDLLQSVVALPLGRHWIDRRRSHWPVFYERLLHAGRASTMDCAGAPCWVATERLADVGAIWGDSEKAPEKVTKRIGRSGNLFTAGYKFLGPSLLPRFRFVSFGSKLC